VIYPSRMRASQLKVIKIGALVAVVALLGSCSSAASQSASTDSNDGQTQGQSEPAPVTLGSPETGHVHNLAFDGDMLMLGTHDGMWRLDPENSLVLVSQPSFDVMGLTRNGDRWLASGHPGPDMAAPDDLGLIQSLDSGVTWQPVSLSGEVDFHRLVASGEVVLGLSAHDGKLLRSQDGGLTWVDLGSPPLYDLAVDPNDPDLVVATSADGPVRSTDGGQTFTPITAPVLLALLAWTDQGLYGASVDGEILYSTNGGMNWEARGSLGGQPVALAANASSVVGFVGDSVLASLDGGVTFKPRISGIGQH